MFAIAYQDNGVFFVNVIDNQGKEISTIDVTDHLKLDASSKPVTGFMEPLITCCFTSDPNQLFVQLFHRTSKTSYHFLYSLLKKLPEAPTVHEVQDCTDMNFPMKSFYNEINNQVYTFYRQGNSSTVDVANPQQVITSKLDIDDMGSMYLLFDRALVTRSSNSIRFFKIDEETGKWVQYQIIENMRGMIYYTKGNVRIQITTESHIYFYIIDKKTLEAKLENVMINYTKSSQLLFGPRVRCGVAYKTGQPGLSLYKRKH